MEQNSCLLCESSLSERAFDRFCCAGCQAVYKILEQKQELEGYEQHPLFREALRGGLISNPDLIKQQKKKEGIWHKLHLEILDLWCPSCAELIQLFLEQKKGVHSCRVDYSTDIAVIEYDPRFISKESIQESICSLGYGAQLLEQFRSRATSFSSYLRCILALFFAANVMMLAYPLHISSYFSTYSGHEPLFAWLSFSFAFPVLTYCALPIYRRFWLALRLGTYGMETLIVLSVSTAFFFSLFSFWQGKPTLYLDSATAVVALVLLGRVLEGKAKAVAKDSLFCLHKSLPNKARKRLSSGELLFVPAKEVSIGDTLVVFTGERICFDGEVIEGEGSCDESLMTGEVTPLYKEIGHSVTSGCLVQSGRLFYRVTSTLDQTMLCTIVDSVDRDLRNTSEERSVLDRLIDWFVPAVCVLALCTFFFSWLTLSWESSLLRALSVLLIACPCAIGIAVPLAESYLIRKLARMGVIVRHRSTLARLGTKMTYLFDKTGTITKGSLALVEGVETLGEEERAALKGLSGQSIHVIARAIYLALDSQGVSFDEVWEHPGRGLEGKREQKTYLLGSRKFLEERGVCVPRQEDEEKAARITLFFCKEGAFLSTLVLQDQLKPEAVEVIAYCNRKGGAVLLSGDATASVAAIAKECGFLEWKAEVDPLAKRDYVDERQRRGETVCMVGDGMNDAAALSKANVGISVPTASDLSISASDLHLTTGDLGVLPEIEVVAKKGRRIIRQNLFWAFCYNGVGLGLAAMGYLSPLFAAVAMVCSSLSVLLNSQRIR